MPNYKEISDSKILALFPNYKPDKAAIDWCKKFWARTSREPSECENVHDHESFIAMMERNSTDFLEWAQETAQSCERDAYDVKLNLLPNKYR